MPNRSTRWNIKASALTAALLMLPGAAMAYTGEDGYVVITPSVAKAPPPVVVVPYSAPMPVNEIVVEPISKQDLKGEDRVFAEIMNAPQDQPCLPDQPCTLDIHSETTTPTKTRQTPATMGNRREVIGF